MLKLLAVAYDDGWAFVEQRGKYWLVRPPYKSHMRSVVSKGTICKAVTAHSFEASEEEFKGWKDLIKHLREKFIASHQARWGEPDRDRMRSLIQDAPGKSW